MYWHMNNSLVVVCSDFSDF